jgi:hypothetical protein
MKIAESWPISVNTKRMTVTLLKTYGATTLTMNRCIHKPCMKLQHDGNIITHGKTNDLHLFNVIKIEKLQRKEQN